MMPTSPPPTSTEAARLARQPVRSATGPHAELIARASHGRIGRGGWSITTANADVTLSGYLADRTVIDHAIACGLPVYDTTGIADSRTLWKFTCPPFLPHHIQVYRADGNWDHWFSWYSLHSILQQADALGAKLHNAEPYLHPTPSNASEPETDRQ